MIGNSFWGVSHRELKIGPTALCWPAFESLQRLSEKAGWPHLPVFGQRVSDNVVLCQLEAGLRAGVDICPWLR